MATAEQTVSAVLDATNKRYVVETGSSEDGSSHFTLYSDGWLEQSGFKTGRGQLTVNFLKEFKDTNYIAFAYPRNGRTGGQYCYLESSSSTTSSIYFYLNGSDTIANAMNWHAEGYAN